jgi:hypothetical protein
MMHKIARSNIQAWLLAVAILISTAHYNVAHAQNNPKQIRTAVAIACGKEIKRHCSGGAIGVPVGVPVGATSVLDCFQKSEEKLSSDAPHWPIMFSAAVTEMQRNFARASSRVLKAILSDA